LPSGHAIMVDHAFYPRKSKLLDTILGVTNKVLRSQYSSINYERNLLHQFLHRFLLQNDELIADYYLNLPVDDGVTVLVKK
jgi:hypothetical protein